MTTHCSGCGRDITKNEKETSEFVVCSPCSRFTPKGVVRQQETGSKPIKKRTSHLKDSIMTFIQGKQRATLQEIYAGVDSNKDSIRAVLNISVKKEDGIQRVEKGVYALI